MDIDSGFGNELQYFAEKERCVELLKFICESIDGTAECELEEITKILDKYLEQSLLVTAHIVDLIYPFHDSSLRLCVNEEKFIARVNVLGKAVYALCRVAGYKHTMKHFPHEVDHLEICLSLLHASEVKGATWEAQYMLLLWLSNLSLIPFDLSSMDSGSNSSAASLVTNVVESCKRHLSDTGPTREAAAVCSAALLTRPDMESKHLSDFMSWGIMQLAQWSLKSGTERSSLSSDYFLLLGSLHSMFQIFKLGHRTKLLPYGPRLLIYCLNLCEVTKQTAARKLLTKLVQRIGMNFLPPRLASWRYMRGNRSLNLKSKKPSCDRSESVDVGPQPVVSRLVHSSFSVVSDAADNAASEENIPDELEEVVDSLLCSMRDSDTVVRWSAAKGIGRIAMRLPRDHASDVVDAVLEVFNDEGSDCSWHGGCLTLAELSRRGLLLPDRLAAVVPYISKAIRFDVLRGQHSIGAHVRDAACYVCWAFSRAYSPTVMAPFIKTLTTALLTTTLFDREVNCRRAASAAYQETVGRQGDQNVPHGIEILTVADYLSVGNRLGCFTVLAPTVARLDETLPVAFIAHLIDVTVRHWDRDMRELAGKALGCLVEDHAAVVMSHLHTLVTGCNSMNLCVRHGSLLGTADILVAVVAKGIQLSGELQSSILGIVPAIEKARLYRGRGGELVREAVAVLIQSIARVKLPMTVKQQVVYVETLNDHLRQPHAAVQSAARDALRDFLFAYFSSGEAPSERLQALTVSKYLVGISTENNVSVTRGYALALGVLPLRLLILPVGRIDQILSSLQMCCSPNHRINGEYDAETCCNSVSAVHEISERITESSVFSLERAQKCFDILIASTDDYNVDNRGDTGSWSRAAAIKAMESLIYAIVHRINSDMYVAITDPKESGIKVGEERLVQVETCFGFGRLVKAEDSELALGGAIVQRVQFPIRSVGWYANTTSNNHIGAGADADPHLVIQRAGHSCGFSEELRWANKSPASTKDLQSLLREQIPTIMSLVLKQLSEKLDAVREVAGGVLLNLLASARADPVVCIPDEAVIRGALCCIPVTAGGQLNEEDQLNRRINWANPNHVYPVVCHLLSSKPYFSSILSGLVVSVGGLSETTSKISAQSLLHYCEELQGGRANGNDVHALVSLIDGLVELLKTQKKVDRVVVPAIKTILVLLNNGVLDTLPAEHRDRVARHLQSALTAEVRGSSSLSKVRLSLELQVQLLSLSPAAYRDGLCAVLPMLTHKYPLIRKGCAEQLYLHLLSAKSTFAASDGDMSSSLPAVSDGSENIDQAVSLLSCTGWEIDDKAQLISTRAAITRLLGFTELADTLEAKFRAGSSRELGASRGPVQSGTDELDSYEALVRDAGKVILI